MSGATCKVGQREECGRVATHAIAVTEVAANVWASEATAGGVVTLCDFHAMTPVSEWATAEAAGGADHE